MIKRKILITGGAGMLGRALWDTLLGEYDITRLDIRRDTALQFERHISLEAKLEVCNITDHKQISHKIRVNNPDIVIHAAALTDVDGCELKEDEAYAVNARGTEAVAAASEEIGALLVYISTDYIFNGKKNDPYLETDKPNPLSVYGKSKLEGEEAVKSKLKRYLIVRSSWLFGRGGKNFIDWVIERAKKKRVLSIVNDRFGSPTYTCDLAGAIKTLLRLTENRRELGEVYHISNSGSCSWYEYARNILKYANLKDVELVPISLSKLNLKAPRPRYSVLDNSRYQKIAGEFLRPWEQAVKEYIKK